MATKVFGGSGGSSRGGEAGTIVPFASGEIVGNGTPQTIGHGLGVVPQRVDVIPVKWPAGTAFDFEVVLANEAQVQVKATLGVSYRVFVYGIPASTFVPPFASLTFRRPQDGSMWVLTLDQAGVVDTNPAGQGAPAFGDEPPPRTVYTTETRPAADVTWAGKSVPVQNDGADEELHYCRKKADGSYEWIVAAY